MLTGSRVLVTGAAGRVGFPIARALATNGNLVYGMARFSDPADREKLGQAGITPLQKDLGRDSFEDLPDVEYLFHAGAALGQECRQSTAWAMEVNVQASGRLLLRYAGVDGFRGYVYCSTGSTYEYQPGARMREDGRPGIHNDANYSFSKIAGEQLISFLSQQHSVPATIIRIFSTYGAVGGAPSDRLDKIVRGEPIYLWGPGPNPYNPIHEDDYAALGVRALEVAAVPPVTVNWGGSETVTAEDYCAYLGELVGREPHIVYDNDRAYWPLWPDTTKMHEVLGRCTVPWKEGFRRMAEARYPELVRAADAARQGVGS